MEDKKIKREIKKEKYIYWKSAPNKRKTIVVDFWKTHPSSTAEVEGDWESNMRKW